MIKNFWVLKEKTSDRLSYFVKLSVQRYSPINIDITTTTLLPTAQLFANKEIAKCFYKKIKPICDGWGIQFIVQRIKIKVEEISDEKKKKN